MGLDFIRKAAPSFHKGLDRSRIELGTPDLFKREPVSTPRAYVANLHNGSTVTAGERLSVRLKGEQVIVLRGLDPVATLERASVELVSALGSSHGEGFGVVQQVHPIAHVAEITVC